MVVVVVVVVVEEVPVENLTQPSNAIPSYPSSSDDSLPMRAFGGEYVLSCECCCC